MKMNLIPNFKQNLIQNLTTIFKLYKIKIKLYINKNKI